MSMDPSRPAADMAACYQSLFRKEDYNGSIDYIRYLETVLDAEFQRATPTETNVDITTVAGTLHFDIVSLDDVNVYDMPWVISRGVADYWSRAIETTGDPVSCGGIDSVENDAPKIIDPLAQDLISQVQQGRDPIPYLRFFTIIIEHVKTIIWTVKESDSDGCSKTFEVTLT